MIHLGFTGTRTGMTASQRDAVSSLVASMLRTYGTVIAHHGDCIGADTDFHKICRNSGIAIHGWPPIQTSMRAFCTFDVEHDPLEFMDRNFEIVRAADRMIACPAEPAEQIRGGTWSTIRLARRAGKKRAIVCPDGTVRIEERASVPPPV